MVDATNNAVGEKSRHTFDLLMNAAGEVMIAFQAVSGTPKKPLFIFDGRMSGRLLKNAQKPDEGQTFSPLPKEARDPLLNAKDILCVEIVGGGIVAEYSARIEVRKNG